MKKSIGIIVFLILLSVCLVFAACENVSNETITESVVDPEPVHTHTFSDIWSKDADYHWHAATCEHTAEIKDKAAHTWNDGEITTLATEEAEGVRTYTCIVCGATKSEVIAKLKKSSEGLAFALKNDDTYEVTGIGTCTDTDVVIPAQYQGKVVTSIESWAFRGCSGLTSVTIPSSVTSIGNYAFVCVELVMETAFPFLSIFVEADNLIYKSIDEVLYTKDESAIVQYPVGRSGSYVIPASVTSIGEGAFYGCRGLTSVSFAEGSQLTNIGNYAFHGCSGLTTITIPSSVTSIGEGAFVFCTGLTSVTIPSSVTSIGESAFYNCSGLTSVTIGEGVTSIGNYAFSFCSGLTSVTIPSSVTSIGNYAFAGCSGLTSITVEAGNAKYHSAGNCLIETESKTLIAGCNNSVIPDDGNVTSIGNCAFYGCSGLTSVTIGSGVTSIGDRAFYNCSGLTSVTIGSGVTSIGDRAFNDCDRLVEVYNQSSLNITKGSGGYGYVGYYAKEIYTSEYVSKLSTDENGYILYTDGANVSLIGYTGLATELTLPTGITEIYQYAFYNCIRLTSVTIPSSVTSIGDCAFEDCSGLTSVTIPSSVTSIGERAFRYCSGLTSIYYTGDVAGWCAISALNDLMSYDSSSKSLYIGGVKVEGDLVIPSDVTSIGDYAFFGCSGLTSVTIPSSVTSIGDCAFEDCSGLTTITIPSSVTSIGEGAFAGCNGLTSVTIPSSVTSIGDYAFSGCSGLTSITYQGTRAQWNAISKGWWNYNTGNYTIRCTDGDINK